MLHKYRRFVIPKEKKLIRDDHSQNGESLKHHIFFHYTFLHDPIEVGRSLLKIKTKKKLIFVEISCCF